MLLSINSTTNTILILKLNQKEKTITHSNPREQDILKAIDEFLTEENSDFTDLTAIEVNTGPGTFTSLRLGIAIAQSLAFALNIPINGKPPGSSIDPEYGAEPNITMKK